MLRMASHPIDWALGVLVCFGSLDIIVTDGGELQRAPTPLSPDSSLDVVIKTFEGMRVTAPWGLTPECCPEPSWEDRWAILLRFANMMAQHVGGGSNSLDPSARGAPTAYPFDLRNATVTFIGFVARSHASTPDDVELVRMADFAHDSIYDILSSVGSNTLSNFGSNDGSEHPSRECYMADLDDVLDGHVSDTQVFTPCGTPPRTPPAHGHVAGDLVDPVNVTAVARDPVDPVRARQAELEEAQCDQSTVRARKPVTRG